jgi:SAM-dependent methyltransferase
MSARASEAAILAREEQLRAWFTRGSDPILQTIDGLDIGWGGVQRWATGGMPDLAGPHLDFACGYGTFLAQLGWRFPGAQLVGLNIDYAGPHAVIRRLLDQASVPATLVQADACRMPFGDGAFVSASCFLGLQDIEIGFGTEGVRAALAEAGRVLGAGGTLTLVDEFPWDKFAALLAGLPLGVTRQEEKPLDTHWERAVAERAIVLYAEGWTVQARPADAEESARIHAEAYRRMAIEMERQLREQGYYVPFGPLRMVVARKENVQR